MVRLTPLALCLSLFLGTGAGTAQAQSVEARLRIERFAMWTGAGAACTRFGYSMPEEKADAAEQAMLAEAAKGGTSEADARKRYSEGMNRQMQLFASESSVLLSAIEDGNPIRPRLDALLLKWDRLCQEAAADAVFGQWLTGGTASERAIARRDFMDTILEKGGEASWQTPKIIARGDLMYAIGACQRHLTQAQTNQLKAAILDGPDPTDTLGIRARAYYQTNLTEGIENAAEMDFDDTQCTRLITKKKADAK
jgi:hypothetical protein